MGIEDIFTSKTNEDVKREIVLELLNSDKNLDEKTELKKPLNWSIMKTIKDYLKEHKLFLSSSILLKFIVHSHKYLISKNRQGRKEYIEALNSLDNIADEKNRKRSMIE